MKKYLVVLAAMAFFIVMVGGVYAATKTGAVGVSATVVNNCSITGGSIAFGTLDASTDAGGKTATVTQPTIKCTKGAGITVTDDKGLYYSGTSRMKGAGEDYIAYSYSYNGLLTGNGFLNDIGGTLNLGASFASGAINDAPAGSYADTLTLTVTY